MELDEFKNLFDQSMAQSAPINANIMNMIYTDTKSPLAAIEKKLKISMYVFPFVVLLFGTRFITQGITRSPTACLLFIILSFDFFISLINYIAIRKIKQPDGPVKDNLLNKITLMRNRYRWYFAVNNCLFVLMAVLLEITMYNHWDPHFEGWSHVNVALRVLFYIVFFVAQYLVKRHSQKKHYGQYLEQLHTLASQME